MRNLRRRASLIGALALVVLPLTPAGSGAGSCPNPPQPNGSQDIFVGTIEYGSNNSSGLHAGYVSPGGAAYLFAGVNGDGAQIWVGVLSLDGFVGAGPGYTNFNDICF